MPTAINYLLKVIVPTLHSVFPLHYNTIHHPKSCASPLPPLSLLRLAHVHK